MKGDGKTMKSKFSTLTFIATLLLTTGIATADEFDDTVSLFKNAGESGAFVAKSYAYAVFPTVAKGGLGVGAAHGSGRAFEQGKYVGDVTLNQLSVGLQAGGQAFSQIVFFQDKRAFDEFTNGNFEFDATAQAWRSRRQRLRAQVRRARTRAWAVERKTRRRSGITTRVWPCSPWPRAG